MSFNAHAALGMTQEEHEKWLNEGRDFVRKMEAREKAKETLRKALAGIEADDAHLGMPELSALLRLVLDEF